MDRWLERERGHWFRILGSTRAARAKRMKGEGFQESGVAEGRLGSAEWVCVTKIRMTESTARLISQARSRRNCILHIHPVMYHPVPLSVDALEAQPQTGPLAARPAPPPTYT